MILYALAVPSMRNCRNAGRRDDFKLTRQALYTPFPAGRAGFNPT